MKLIILIAVFTSMIGFNVQAEEVESTCDKSLDFESRKNPKEDLPAPSTQRPVQTNSSVIAQ